MIIYFYGQHYRAEPWTDEDVQQARMAYNARERSQPEYDQQELESINRIKLAVAKGEYKLVPIT
jgi:hypothetical protein